MTKRRIVIVGGVAGGMTTAAKLKREAPQLEVAVYERSHYISYSACGMPYLLEGKVRTLAQLIARGPEQMREQGVELHLRHEVTGVDAAAKRLDIRNLDTGETLRDRYDQLVLATGARPVVPELPGVRLPGVHSLRRLEDISAIRARLDEGARRAVVIGGGYVGLEMAEAFREAGLEVTLLERAERLLHSYEPALSELVREELEAHGVEVRLGCELRAFEGERRLERVRLKGGSVAADLALLAVGARPNSELAEALGLELGPEGAVLTDERLATSQPDIYAVGDVSAVKHRVSGEPVWLPLGDTANQQGRVLAQVLAAQQARFPGVLGTLIVKVFGRGFAKTGLSVEEAEAAGFEVASRLVTARDRAAYYPGVRPLAVQLVWEAGSERLLGAQLAGYGDAAKRIDVFAALVQHGASLADISALDLAYAPPYSPSLDPVIVAANVARGGGD